MDIGNINFVNTMTIAGVTIPRNQAIILRAGIAAGKFQTLRKNGVNYQVSAGKTLKILAMKGFIDSTTASAIANIGYGDTAVDNSSSSPTNAVGIVDGTPAYLGYATVSIALEVPLNIEILAGKYPYMVGSAASVATFITFLCVEE